MRTSTARSRRPGGRRENVSFVIVFCSARVGGRWPLGGFRESTGRSLFTIRRLSKVTVGFQQGLPGVDATLSPGWETTIPFGAPALVGLSRSGYTVEVSTIHRDVERRSLHGSGSRDAGVGKKRRQVYGKPRGAADTDGRHRATQCGGHPSRIHAMRDVHVAPDRREGDGGPPRLYAR